MPPLTVEETLDMLGAARPPHDARGGLHRAHDPRAYRRPAGLHTCDGRRTRRDGGARRRGRQRSGQCALRRCWPTTGPWRACATSATSCVCIARAGTARSRPFSRFWRNRKGSPSPTIAQRLQRTPGSTKDYLSWLEDVDLITAHQKRYSFTDPLLRVWVRLHCQAVAPTEDDIAREVHRYALPRLPQQPEPRPQPAEAAVRHGLGGRLQLRNHRD